MWVRPAQGQIPNRPPRALRAAAPNQTTSRLRPADFSDSEADTAAVEGPADAADDAPELLKSWRDQEHGSVTVVEQASATTLARHSARGNRPGDDRPIPRQLTIVGTNTFETASASNTPAPVLDENAPPKSSSSDDTFTTPAGSDANEQQKFTAPNPPPSPTQDRAASQREPISNADAGNLL